LPDIRGFNRPSSLIYQNYKVAQGWG